MIRRFLAAIKDGGPAPIPFEELYAVTLATFRAAESVREGGEWRKLSVKAAKR